MSSPEAAEQGPYRGHALVAEDDADMREIVQSYLEGKGWHVVALEAGSDALACATDDRFALAVVDVRASVSQGMVIVRTLRACSRALPIIVTTGFADLLLGTKLAAMGVNAVLEKPFDLEELGRVLEGCA